MQPLDATTRPDLRASHADRDDCASYLVEHHLSGRLSTEELERRQRAALSAVTISELRALFADLPGDAASRLGRAATTPAPRHPSRSAAEWRQRLPWRRLWSAGTTVVPPVAVVVATAAYSQDLWQYTSEGALNGGLLTGGVALVTGVVSAKLHQRRKDARGAAEPATREIRPSRTRSSP